MVTQKLRVPSKPKVECLKCGKPGTRTIFVDKRTGARFLQFYHTHPSGHGKGTKCHIGKIENIDDFMTDIQATPKPKTVEEYEAIIQELLEMFEKSASRRISLSIVKEVLAKYGLATPMSRGGSKHIPLTKPTNEKVEVLSASLAEQAKKLSEITVKYNEMDERLKKLEGNKDQTDWVAAAKAVETENIQLPIGEELQ